MTDRIWSYFLSFSYWLACKYVTFLVLQPHEKNQHKFSLACPLWWFSVTFHRGVSCCCLKYIQFVIRYSPQSTTLWIATLIVTKRLMASLGRLFIIKNTCFSFSSILKDYLTLLLILRRSWFTFSHYIIHKAEI